MLILDCCHAGKWVEMVNALTIETAQGRVKRRDICVQAACRPVKNSMVASNQQSSVFTRAFIAAQSKSPLEKLVLSAIDHALVLSIVSIACSPIRHPFTPISSDLAPQPALYGMYFYTTSAARRIATLWVAPARPQC